MNRTVTYLLRTVIACAIFYAGFKFGRYNNTPKTETIVQYDLLDQDGFTNTLINTERNANWEKKTVNDLLEAYRKINKDTHIEEYPLYIEKCLETFSDHDYNNQEIDMYKTCMHRLQYLYVNHLKGRMPNENAKNKLSEAISVYRNWERTLISLYSNNMLLGACTHRYYTFECANITFDALDNLCLLLDWLDKTQKGDEPNTEKLYGHNRWLMQEDYHENLKITEEALKEIEEAYGHKMTYIPTFEDEPGNLDITPEIGDKIIASENKAWNDLLETLIALGDAYKLTDEQIEEWQEWMTVARYNALFTVINQMW